METTAVLTEDGDAWILNGKKLWCTNGGLAKYLVVMAKTPGKRAITAFIVHTDWPGVKDMHRCSFMGIRGMQERAQLIGGRLEIASQPDRGTTVTLAVPI